MFFVRAIQAVTRLSVLIFCPDRGTFRRIDKFFPVTAIKHEAIVFEAEFALGSPLRFSAPVQVPFSDVAGAVAFSFQKFGKSDDIVTERNVVGVDRRFVWVHAGDQGRP